MSDSRPHLQLPSPAEHEFLNPRRGRGEPAPLPLRDRQQHAAFVKEQLDSLVRSWSTQERLPDATGRLATVQAAEGSELAADSLGDKRTGITVVEATDTTALLHIRGDTVRALENKVRDYAQKDTKAGRPSNEPLIAPIQRVGDAEFADLASGELAKVLIDPASLYWVELWTLGGRLAPERDRRRVRGLVDQLVARSGDGLPEPVTFVATERDIHLVQLAGSVLLELPSLAPDVYRVARPANARADRLARVYAGELIDAEDVQALPADGVVVTILDTGVAEEHPLLAPLMTVPGVSVVPGEASAIDKDGHGTELAGLAAYGDLSAALLAGAPVIARANLENVRCQADGGSPPFWAARTEAAVEAAETFAQRPRVFNLALSDPGNTTAERSSWSVAIDSLAHNGEHGRLICVAIGNAVELKDAADYPLHNMASFLHDPGHAVNALTIGAVTHRDTLADDAAQGPLTPVAMTGQLSPYTSTNLSSTMPIKPEIVMEGGNACPDGILMNAGEPDLSVLSTDRGHATGELLSWTWATSAACALASGVTAEIWSANPGRSPQTIRALLVNSARWTKAIRDQHPDRKERLRAVGYGEPQTEIAFASTLQRPTLILEGSLAPEAAVGAAARGMQVTRLPLPEEELLALGAHQVELAITLSYFGEPNESRRTRYLGSTLAWDLQRRGESEAEFLRRVSDSWRKPGTPRPAPAEAWPWEVGPDARSRGTVQGDRMCVEAASLAGEKLIAVWPTQGWWADHLKTRSDSRISYALVVTIDAGEADIELYELIASRIAVLVDAS